MIAAIIVALLHVFTILPGIRAARQQGQYKKMVFLDLGSSLLVVYGAGVWPLLILDRSASQHTGINPYVSTNVATLLVATYIAAYLTLAFMSWKTVTHQRRDKVTQRAHPPT